MTDDWDRIDAADWLLAELESESEVAYAEVGAVREQYLSAAVRPEDHRATEPVETTGVWCRAFVEGSPAYRFTTTLTEENLESVSTRVRRSARLLGQDTPSKYDPDVLHRDSHPGWGETELSPERDPLGRVERAFEPLRGRGVDDASVRHQRRVVDIAVLTTTGSTVRTTLDRGEVTASVETDSGRLRSHVGTTDGDVLDRADEAVAPLVDALERRERLPSEPPESGRRTVVLGPVAAAQTVHALSHYFEMDQRYMGARPFELGERIAPESLTVRDLVVPGGWTAMAYDAEANPTQPVTLIDRGVVASFLHDTETALEEGTRPAGSVVFPFGFENPPRVHARHLDVDAGGTDREELLADDGVYVERFGPPFLGNEATRTKRRSWMPSAALYGKDTHGHTPDRYDESAQTVRFRIADGYRIEDGERAAALSGGELTVSPADLDTIDGVGTCRETVTGTCSKHKSMLPFGVTAPAIRLTATVEAER